MEKTELDYELEAMCDTIMYRCACGIIDMHGMALYEYFGSNCMMTGILCRTCTANMLPEWLKAK
jgi:hypothetical protein